MKRSVGNFCNRTDGLATHEHAVCLFFETKKQAEETAVAFGLLMADLPVEEPGHLALPCAISLGVPNVTQHYDDCVRELGDKDVRFGGDKP